MRLAGGLTIHLHLFFILLHSAILKIFKWSNRCWTASVSSTTLQHGGPRTQHVPSESDLPHNTIIGLADIFTFVRPYFHSGKGKKFYQ